MGYTLRSADASSVRTMLLAALIDGDLGVAYEISTGLLQEGVPFEVLVTDVIGPVQTEIGRRWADGDLTIADEHASTAATESLVALLAGTLAPADGPTVVIACPENDTHSLPGRVIAAALAVRGFRAMFLGASLPAGDLGEFVEHQQPMALGAQRLDGVRALPCHPFGRHRARARRSCDRRRPGHGPRRPQSSGDRCRRVRGQRYGGRRAARPVDRPAARAAHPERSRAPRERDHRTGRSPPRRDRARGARARPVSPHPLWPTSWRGCYAWSRVRSRSKTPGSSPSTSTRSEPPIGPTVWTRSSSTLPWPAWPTRWTISSPARVPCSPAGGRRNSRPVPEGAWTETSISVRSQDFRRCSRNIFS